MLKKTAASSLTKTLFRSLLRWTRQPHVICSPFSLSPFALQVEKYLPASLQQNRTEQLVNAEGVQAAIFNAFRTSKGDSSDLDEALRVIRELNALGTELKTRYALHVTNKAINEIVKHSFSRNSPYLADGNVNSDSDSLAEASLSSNLVWHQVGDVVYHKELGYRAVVIAWNVPVPNIPNTDTPVPLSLSTFSGSTHLRQQVSVLVDESDAMHLHHIHQYKVGNRDNNWGMKQDLSNRSKMLDMETDFSDMYEACPTPLLNRIINKRIDIHFKSFDNRAMRYVPNENLNFQYPNFKLDGKTSTAAQIKVGHIRKDEQIFVEELNKLGNSMAKTSRMVENTLEEYLKIFRHYGIRIDATSSYSLQEEFEDPSSKRLNELASKVLESILPDFEEGIKAAKRGAARDDLQNPQNPPNSPSKTDYTSIAESHQMQMRGEGEGIRFQKHINIGSKSLLKEILLSRRHESSDLSRRPLFDRINIELPGTGNRPSLSYIMQNTFVAMKSLSNINARIDQFLQLRFQQNGISYVENLVQPIDLLIKRYESPTQRGGNSGSVGVVVEEEEMMSFPPQSRTDLLSSQPAIQFQIGQVVKHTKFGYRGIISGFDQRPLTDVSSWEAVRGSLLGSDQPFYNVIPDENDIETHFGEGQYRERMYVAQENLVLVDDADDKVIVNKSISFLYDDEIALDSVSGRYKMPLLLQFCFPKTPRYLNSSLNSQSPSVASSTSPASNGDKEDNFAIMERALIDMFSVHKHALIKSRLDHCLANSSSFTADSSLDIGSSHAGLQGRQKEAFPIITAERRLECEEKIRKLGGMDKPSNNFSYLKNYNHSSVSNSNSNNNSDGNSSEELKLMSMLSTEEIEKEVKKREASFDSSSSPGSGSRNPSLENYRRKLEDLEEARTRYNSGSTKQYLDRLTIPVADLFSYMKEASNREDANLVEWFIWLTLQCHHEIPVSRLMRHGMSAMSRGGYNDAFICFAEILTDLDPMFAEAANKLADIHHATGEPRKCYERARLAMSLCHGHVGAMSSQGASLELLGDKQRAVSYFEKVLDASPWIYRDIPLLVKAKYLPPLIKVNNDAATIDSQGPPEDSQGKPRP